MSQVSDQGAGFAAGAPPEVRSVTRHPKPKFNGSDRFLRVAIGGLLRLVIFDGGLERFLGQHGTVNLHRGQRKLLHDNALQVYHLES